MSDILVGIVLCVFLFMAALFLFTDRSRQVKDIERANTALEECRERSHQALEASRSNAAQMRALAVVYHQQLRAAGVEPMYRLPEEDEANAPPAQSAQSSHDTLWLRDTLTRYFTREELELVPESLELEWGSVGGETVPLIAQNIVKLAERRGKLDELRALVERLRPNVQ